MSDATEIGTVIRDIAWPLLAGIVLWRLLPILIDVMKGRAFSFRLGQFEFTAQEWSESVVRSTAEAQEGVAELKDELAAIKEALPSPIADGGDPVRVLAPAPIRKILWVDDGPGGRRYEAAQLEALGAQVTQASSTDHALERLSRESFDLLITNLGRNEKGGYDPDAGRVLVEAARRHGFSESIIIYNPGGVPEGEKLREAGANGLADTPARLFEALRSVGWLATNDRPRLVWETR